MFSLNDRESLFPSNVGQISTPLSDNSKAHPVGLPGQVLVLTWFKTPIGQHTCVEQFTEPYVPDWRLESYVKPEVDGIIESI